jgi:hypothetical protein
MKTRGVFSGRCSVQSDGDGQHTVEFDGGCNSTRLGEALGVIARAFMQKIPAEIREEEFRALLAAFVVSTADATPLDVQSGELEALLPVGPSSKVPS